MPASVAKPAADHPAAGRRSWSLPLAAAALAAVLAGYADLWRGGTSPAATLLVLGYCVLAPAALWASPGEWRADGDAPTARPPYRIAACVAAAVFALYALTLAPTTAMWDASEYIAVARILGLPHPPGNPLFVLLAHVAGLAPLPVPYAVRINLLAALASAASAGLWFLCADRALRAVVSARVPRLLATAAGTLVGATAFTVWNQSVVNEKVYTVSLLGLALTSWLVLRWLDVQDAADPLPADRRDPARARGDRLLLLMVWIAGLGYAVHPAGFLAGPAVAAAVLVRRPSTLLRPRLLLAGGGLLVAALTLFAVEPIRSAHLPAINEGMPTACEGGRPEVGCTLSAETGRRLLDNVRRQQYGGHAVAVRKAPLAAQLGMWWMYFEWQWLRDPDGRHPGAQRLLALAFLGVALVGLAAVRRDRHVRWYLVPLAATLTLALVYYLNFAYAFSQAPELGDAVRREVRDRDYFFVWTFSAWGVFVALGLGALWQRAAAAMAAGGAPTRRAWALAAPLLLLAVVPGVANLDAASRRGQTFTRDWARDLLSSVEPYGVLVTAGDNDSFPLWYAQQVEGYRRDVTVALVPYLGLPWYARQLLAQPPAAYDSAAGPAAYATGDWRRPDAPLWRLSPKEADAMPDYIQLREPQRFLHLGIAVTLPPGILTRDQLLVLRAIKDTFPERPVYFSNAIYPSALGLAPYLRQQGLAYRLEPGAPAASESLVPIGGGIHLDLPRTRWLWERSYAGAAALQREGRWVDRASASIPAAYAVTGQHLAAALAARGDTASALRVADQVESLARAARLIGPAGN